MPSVVFDHDDHPPGLPDDLKMPERHAHRQAVDMIALAATRRLDPSMRVFRDMNWYPADGGNATAPDIMVLPADAVEESPRSYRQGDGPPPAVIVEIPSDDDGFAQFRAKARRAQALGAVVYVVVVDGPDPAVLRLGPGDLEGIAWTGQPIPELAGLVLDFEDRRLAVVLPDGGCALSDADLLAIADAQAAVADAQAAQANARAAQANARAAAAEAQAAAAEARAADLARLLREHGIEPASTDR